MQAFRNHLWSQGSDDDREVEDEHDEPTGDEEPALGTTTAMNQSPLGGRIADAEARATKRCLLSAGPATGTAIPKRRCAATTKIASMMTSARKITTSRRNTADDCSDGQTR